METFPKITPSTVVSPWPGRVRQAFHRGVVITVDHPVVITAFPWYKWPIEIDGLPIKNGDFPWFTY